MLRDKASTIAKNLKYDGYQRGLASMAHKLFDKKLLLHAHGQRRYGQRPYSQTI